jgi:valyl-tRNA synthetase
MLAALQAVVREATESFEDYEHSRALDATERFFWGFTDDYLELVKQRAYGAAGETNASSAATALRQALDVLLRLFAPFLPYVTEEVWSWWREGSVHEARWPQESDLTAPQGDPEVYVVTAGVLTAVRKEKALAKLSLRVPVDRVTVHDEPERLAKLALAQGDLCQAGNITKLELVEGPAGTERSVEVVLGELAPS